MVIKVNFNTSNNITFTEGENYLFTSINTNQSINFAYLGISRIDGGYIFIRLMNEPSPKEPLANYLCNSLQIDNLELVSYLEDHIPNNYYSDNKKKLEEYFQEQLEFNYDDLFEKDAYKKIIRNFKLKYLIDDKV